MSKTITQKRAELMLVAFGLGLERAWRCGPDTGIRERRRTLASPRTRGRIRVLYRDPSIEHKGRFRRYGRHSPQPQLEAPTGRARHASSSHAQGSSHK